VPFDYLRFLVRGQFVKHLAQMGQVPRVL